MKMELNEAIDKLNKAGLITEFLGFGKRKITDDEIKLKAIEELFEDDSVKQTGPGKFEAKNMEQYDVITYYEVAGSGEYKDGILDKWVKISSTEIKEEEKEYRYGV